MILALRARKEQILRTTKEARLRDKLDQAAQQLEETDKRLGQAIELEIREAKKAKTDAPVMKPVVIKGTGRAWFAGLGKICIGTGAAFANIWLVASLPFNPTSGSAAIAFATLGFGTILEGLGKLRGEESKAP